MNQSMNTSQNITVNNSKTIGYSGKINRSSYGGNSYTNNNGGYGNTIVQNGAQKSSGYGLKKTNLNGSTILNN